MKKREKKWFRFRIVLILMCFLCGFLVLLSRAFQLQVISGERLKAIAKNQYTRTMTLRPDRGVILDRKGQKLAVTTMVKSICADPSMVDDPSQAARRIAQVLSYPVTDIRQDLSRNSQFAWIKRCVSMDVADRIMELGINGIFSLDEPKRFYPNRELCCHVLGIVGLDSRGLEGLEREYNNLLRKKAQKVSWVADARGKRIYVQEKSGRDDENIGNLLLTIDSTIQYIVESKLKDAAARTGAKKGTAIVMEVKTGRIVAMANVPRFNCNDYGRFQRSVRKNSAVMDSFEPGSVFKPFVLAAALEEGVLAEDDVLFCENGSYRVGRRTIHEAFNKQFEELTVREIIKKSSNIGAAKIGEAVGKDTLYRYIRKFGFGEKTGIDLPGEATGIVRPHREWKEIDFASVCFGQSLSVTAIQLLRAMSAIANDGVMLQPYVVQGIVDEKGRVIKDFIPSRPERVLSRETAHRVKDVLTDVVAHGTGTAARIPGIAVAGKTGTSQKFDVELNTYSGEKVVASFMGFFPADKPELCVLVFLDEPKVKRWGGQAAAPVFAAISEQIVNCFSETIKPTVVAADKALPRIPSLTVRARPASFIERHPEESAGFDFTGMTMRDVLREAALRRIPVRVSGSGWAVDQKIMHDGGAGGRPVLVVFFDNGE